MEAFLTAYGLPYGAFRELMCTTNSLVAGSAALSLYLQQEGLAGFEEGDLDVWVDTRSVSTPIVAPAAPMQSGAMQSVASAASVRSSFLHFLLQNQYALVRSYATEYNSVCEILSFERDGKKVQVILVNESDLIGYVRDNFDLSVCMTWWDAQADRFETLWPETLRFEMHVESEDASEAVIIRQVGRIQKYEARGFRLVEHPCPAFAMRDELVGLEELGTAFDTISYEEVNCAEFLRSSWHVLLRVGEQFHAYDRRDLVRYMEAHAVHSPIGVLYDTPHKQSLTEEAKEWLLLSDYAIAVLVAAGSMEIGRFKRSVHECFFFTVEEWLKGSEGTLGVPGVVCEVPLEAFQIASGNVGAPSVTSAFQASAHSVSDALPLYHPDVYWMDG